MSFKLRLRKKNGVPILAVTGDITGGNIGKLTAKMEHLFKNRSERVAIDLCDVSFIDSHGLGVFVFFYRRLKEEGRTLVILKPSEFVAELLSGSNLDRIFNVLTTEQEL